MIEGSLCCYMNSLLDGYLRLNFCIAMSDTGEIPSVSSPNVASPKAILFAAVVMVL